MALDDRRTTVTIDLTVGQITLPEGTLEVPAQLRVEAPTDGAAGAAAEEAGGQWERLLGILGPRLTRRIMGAMKYVKGLGAALGISTAAAFLLAAAIATIAAAIAFVIWRARKFIEVLGKLYQVYVRVGRAIYDANKQIIEFLRAPVEATIRRTLDVLGQYHDKLRSFVEDAVRRSYDLLQKYYGMARDAVREGYQALRGFLETAGLAFAEFEQDVANTVTVMNDFGEAGMRTRERMVDMLSAITMHSRRMASDAAKASYAIASAGFGQEQQIKDILEGTILLSEATLQSLVPSAEMLVATINRFGLEASEAARAVNVMTAAITQSPATVDKLEASFRYVGPVSRLFGESLESVVAALMAFYKAGYRGSTAGMEMFNVFNDLMNMTKKKRDMLESLGLTVEQVSPAYRDLVDIVAEFEKLQGRLTRPEFMEMLSTVFGIRGMRGMGALVTIGSQQMRDMERAITGTNTAIQMQADQLMTLQGQWALVLSKWERAQFMTMTRLNPALQEVLASLNAMMVMLLDRQAFEALGDVLAVAVRDFLSILEPLTEPAYRFGRGMLDVLGRALKEIGNIARAAAPSVEKLLGIIPAIAGDAVGALGPALAKVVSVVGPFFVEWVRVITPKMVELGVAVASLVAEFFTLAQPTILRWFTMLIDLAIVVVRYFEDNIPRAIAFFETLIAAMPSLLGDFLNLLSEVARMVLLLTPIWLKFIGQLIRSLTDFLGQNGDKMLEWVNTLLQMIVQLLEAAPQLFPAFQKFLDLLIRMLPEILEKALQFLPKMVDLFEQFLDLVERFLGTYIPILQTAFKELLDLLDKMFRETLPAALSALEQSLPRILEALSRIADVFERILDILERLFPLFDGLMKMMVTHVTWLLENLPYLLRELVRAARVLLTMAFYALLPLLLVNRRLYIELERRRSEMQQWLAELQRQLEQEVGSRPGWQWVPTPIPGVPIVPIPVEKPVKPKTSEGGARPPWVDEDEAQAAGERRASALDVGGARLGLA